MYYNLNLTVLYMISISNFLKHYYLLYPIPTILREIKECLPEWYEERELIKRLADFNIDDSHSDDFIRIHVENYMIELFLAARETVEEKLGPEVADRYEDWILNSNISFDIYIKTFSLMVQIPTFFLS